MAVLNKPAGMLSVPGKIGRYSVATWAEERWPEAMIAHRLDMWTSGMILVAKAKETYLSLQEQEEISRHRGGNTRKGARRHRLAVAQRSDEPPTTDGGLRTGQARHHGVSPASSYTGREKPTGIMASYRTHPPVKDALRASRRTGLSDTGRRTLWQKGRPSVSSSASH